MKTEFSPKPLKDWILKREQIRRRKEAGDKRPWTFDPILRDYFFCNAFREYDRVTKHYIEWIRKSRSNKSLVLSTCAYRLINEPESMEDLGILTTGRDIHHHVFSTLDKRKKEGKRIFGGAYIITNAGQKKPKHLLVAEALQTIADSLHNGLGAQLSKGTLESAFNRIRTYPLVGDFIAYEIVTDLSYNILKDAEDLNTFVNLGPGAKRGLNRLLGRELTATITKKDATELMIAIHRHYLKDKEFMGMLESKSNWTLRAVEHSLCEFDKYERVRLNQGRMKRKYNGRG